MKNNILNKKIRLNKKLIFFISLGIFVFVFVAFFMKNNFINCKSYFQFCKNDWHYEKNFLGQKVSVHYKVDLVGKRLQNSFTGCEYDGNIEDYYTLIMQLPGIKVVEDDANHRVYQFLNGSKGYLNKKTKPYPDDALSFAINSLVFKGTSCEIKSLDISL